MLTIIRRCITQKVNFYLLEFVLNIKDILKNFYLFDNIISNTNNYEYN